MNYKISILLAALVWVACTKKQEQGSQNQPDDFSNFEYMNESFADIQILRYNVPGFTALSAQQKELLYYLYQAALCGNDITWDQNYKYNLTVRKTLQAILMASSIDTTTKQYHAFMVYAKNVFFSKGIHHHYSSNKLIPEFSATYLGELIKKADQTLLPLKDKETVEQFIVRITPVICDPKVAPKKVNLDSKQDLVLSSAVNFYNGVTQKEVEDFYKKIIHSFDSTPVSFGLNSQLVKLNGKVQEKTWKIGGMYSSAIEKIVYWLEKAIPVAETEAQKKALQLLVEFYKTGDLEKFDEYSIAWVQDTASVVDVVNGFIEVYNDPLGYRGTFESMVSIRDEEITKRIKSIGNQAQWFEDNSSLFPEHKKKNVKGITAKVINVVVESGDAAPSTPIGVNLPNSNWIRQRHGSKSVTLGNIVHSNNEEKKSNGELEEFWFGEEIINRAKKYRALSEALQVDMHEVIGHASGQLNPGVADFSVTLKNYANTLEEARADLVALYYAIDQKLVDIGVMPSIEVGMAQYDYYITNALLKQMSRIPAHENQLEEAHMRNRQLIALWAYEKGKSDSVIVKKVIEGKTYFHVLDYTKLRTLFGQLLKEIQRIKSEGDYKAGRHLVETYGVKLDPQLHKEVLERYSKLNLAPYKGFIQPVLTPVMEDGKIKDVQISYPDHFLKQMLDYSSQYSFLPIEN